MISGMYLGELTRLVLVHLHGEGAVFGGSAAAGAGDSGTPKPSVLSRQLETPWAFETRLLSDLSEDASTDLEAVGRILREELGMPRSTIEDRRVVQEAAVRAAHVWRVGVVR